MQTPVITRVNSRRDRKAFIDLPYRIYADNPKWVPPLRLDTAHIINPKKNAFFDHGEMELFLARTASGEVVGRIGAIVNGMHLKKYEDGAGFFGFFESIDDLSVSTALFDAAGVWLRGKGLSCMRGPANPSLNDTAGLLIDGFDRQPAILMAYNAPYYERLLLDYGFERVMTMWSYYTSSRIIDDARLFRGADIVRRRNPGLTIREIDMDRFEEEANVLREIYNDAWSDNWGHVAMTDREFAQMAKDMKQIINPKLITIIEDDTGPIAFSASIRDMNYAFKTIPNGRLHPFGVFKLIFLLKMGVIRELRMPLMGVRKKYHGKGLDAWLVADITERAREIGLRGCEMSWVLDNNHRLKNFLETIGAVQENEYGLFETAVGA